MNQIPLSVISPTTGLVPKPTNTADPLDEQLNTTRPDHVVNIEAISGTAFNNPRNSVFSLRPVSQKDIKTLGLPDLRCMPLVLRTGFMCAATIYNLLILSFLIVIWFKEDLTFTHDWHYFASQILPPILGSITSLSLRAISMNLYRIMPFMLAAAPVGSTFKETILASYYPGLDFLSAIKARNSLLVAAFIVESLTGFVLSFKSVLLNPRRDPNSGESVAIVTPWALKALIGIYCLTIVFTAPLLYRLRNRVTGLRWDPTSIADHLALFRHSAFLDDFKGTDIATRDSIEYRFRQNRIKLGYWHRGDEIWHGFETIRAPGRYMETSTPCNPSEAEVRPHTGIQSPGMNSQTLATQKYSSREVSTTRYRSVFMNYKHEVAYVWLLFTSSLLTAYILGLKFGLVDGMRISMSYNWAAVAFQFIPTILIELYNWFWQDIDIFARSTQPFRGMSGLEGDTAIETLLLDYNTTPPWVVAYTALSKRHYRIALTSLMAVVQRLLPILVAGSISIDPEVTGMTIYASKPLFYIIVVILRSGDGDAFDIDMLDKKTTEQWYMNARLRTKLDRNGKDFLRYSFGLYDSVKHKGVKCMGFDVTSNVEVIKTLRRRIKDNEAVEESTTMHSVKVSGLEYLLGESSERPTDVRPLTQHTLPDQNEEE
ncbi:hypothetical protein OPT61_g5971 [Boeremia exigua]|uniref:Uncharacterized protein n=1 Tax=Boeremia exigua TaxID=749465 RepID=A0ACC2I8D0_9PLEO|nr:hypothetical protein OPT61_g5971 [Boeremia exigua]